jgi:hypothetical protein
MRFVTAGTGTATLLVQNSTFTGNIVKLPSAATTSGTVTLSIVATGTSDVKLVNNTIAYNTSEIATSTANGLFIGGVTDKIVAINNIIYSNTRPDNSDYSITTATNIKLKESRNNITSQAFNFAANTTTGASSDNVSSVAAINLGLAATLANNGGETQTLALSAGSSAINNGYATGAPSVDQRNVTRVGTKDVGAYEGPSITGAATTTAFTTTYGTASAAQNFSVSGTNLTTDLVATAPTGFEVSSDGISYAATASFTPTSGSASGTLRIRLKANAAVSGTYNSQNIVLSSTNATPVNIVTAASGNAVSAKALTITAANQTVAYGTLVATVTGAGTYTPTGFVNSETASVIGGSVTYTTNFTNTTAAATSGITITPDVSALTATNYSFTPADGTITITPADVAVSSPNISLSDLILSPVSNITVNTNGSLLIDQSKQIASVTVNAGAKLSVADGQTLTLTNLTLKSDVNGTSTYVPTGTNKTGVLTVTGTTAVEQYLATTRNWYVSSPVSNAVAPAGYTYYGRYEPGGTASGWTPVSVGGGLVAGKGYIALPTTAGVPITFTTQSGGTLNNGTVTIPLSYTSNVNSGKGYNLIGNPYPSHLSWTNEFTQANASKIESTIWYRTNSGSTNASGWSFVTFNPVTAETVPSTANGGIIPPMQAFWVLAKDVPSNSIQFTNAMRSHQTGNPLRTPAAKNLDRKKIRLQLSNGTAADEALIVFDANASNDYDSYDSPKMMNNAADIADIYTVMDTKKLVINGLNAVTNNMILPLGYNAGVEGSLTLKVNELSNFDGNTRVYLVDGSTETELAQGTEYSFNTAKITGNESRFSLLFRAPNASTGIDNSSRINTQIFVNANNQITIIAPEKVTYNIYNALGQLVSNGKTITNRTMVNSIRQAGVYVVNLNENRTKLTTRLIIK